MKTFFSIVLAVPVAIFVLWMAVIWIQNPAEEKRLCEVAKQQGRVLQYVHCP